MAPNAVRKTLLNVPALGVFLLQQLNVRPHHVLVTYFSVLLLVAIEHRQQYLLALSTELGSMLVGDQLKAGYI